MIARKLKLLVIYYHAAPPEETRNTIISHLRVLEASDVDHDITYYNTHDDVPDWTKIDIASPMARPTQLSDSYDAIILHYTFLSNRTLGLPFYKWKREFDWIKTINGLKVALPLDEGSFPGTLDDWLFELGVSIIFSVHYTDDRPLYPLMRSCAEIYPCIPGYIDKPLADELAGSLRPIAEREKDICYRAYKLPFWIGKSGQLKTQIADVFIEHLSKRNLVCDISTNIDNAVFGSAWMDFLASTKSVIGVQGGFSAIDWRGELRSQVEKLEKSIPSLTFAEFDERMATDWDNYKLFTITPRHFEAIITRTGQILIEGEYKGILKPDRHYIPLKADYSNIDDVLDKLQDHQYLQEMVDRCYDEILGCGDYSYKAFAHQIEKAILQHESSSLEGASTMQQTNTITSTEHEALQRELIAQRQQNAALIQQVEEIKYDFPRVINEAVIHCVKSQPTLMAYDHEMTVRIVSAFKKMAAGLIIVGILFGAVTIGLLIALLVISSKG